MRHLLAAAAVAGLFLTGAPAANACAWEYCVGTSVVCATFGCPVACSPNVPVADRRVCVL
jgi:hypothetical protein